MKKLIIVILAAALFLLSCQKNLTEEEKQGFREARGHRGHDRRTNHHR